MNGMHWNAAADSEAPAASRLGEFGASSVRRALFRELPQDAWNLLEEQVERYEAVWELGERPRIEDFLVLPDPTDGQLLVELVFIELERRLRRGETPTADEYLADYPEVAKTPQLESALRSLENEFASASVVETVAGSTMDCEESQSSSDSSPRHSSFATDAAGQVFRLAHFELLEQVGSGGFGVVWKARDRRLNRIVAVKIPHPHRLDVRSRANLLREARAAARLSHPGIISIHDVDVSGTNAFLVYEYIKGMTLSAWLSQNRFSPRDAAAACLGLTRAVCHAHECGIVHRDLKPSNVLIDESQVLRITDFGLAKWCDVETDATLDGVIIGSVPYMSPEQASGSARTADVRTDVYGLGVVLYEMLTGRPPFRADDPNVLKKILHQEPLEPRLIDPLIPPALQAICVQSIAKRPQERYSTASALADDLERFLGGTNVVARRRRLTNQVARWLRIHSKALSGLTVAVVFAVALFLAGKWNVSGQPTPASPLARAALFREPEAELEQTPEPNLILHPAFRPRPVEFRTSPPGAEVWVFPRDRLTGAVRPQDRIAGSPSDQRPAPASFELPPGDYLVVAELADGRFTAVNHHIPLRSEPFPTLQSSLDWHPDRRKKDGIWIDIHIPPVEPLDQMVFVPAGELTATCNGSKVRLTLPAFYLSEQKLDYEAYRSLRTVGGAAEPDAVPDYLKNRPLAGGDAMTLAYADAETLFAHAGLRVPEEAELAYAATLDDGISGLNSGADELTGTWYAPSPWTVGNEMRRLQYEFERAASPEEILPLVRSHLVFRLLRSHHQGSLTLGAERPDIRFANFREKFPAFGVRAARHVKAPRDESDFIRFEVLDR